MKSEYEKFQERIMEKARQVYCETVLDHATNPRNLGSMPDEDGYAKAEGECGDIMEIWIRVEQGKISEARFMTDGCGTSIASGSMVTVLATGKEVPDAQAISPQDVLTALGGLPEENRHCADLAAAALRVAIADYYSMQKEPWKKAYRKH